MTVNFQCDENYVPSVVMIATCNSQGLWEPDPSNHNCTFVVGKNLNIQKHGFPMPALAQWYV
jgi:hypothetical protein